MLQLGELRVDPVRHVVQAAGEPVNLTLKEFELLCLLLDNPGQGSEKLRRMPTGIPA